MPLALAVLLAVLGVTAVFVVVGYLIDLGVRHHDRDREGRQ
jgi:hypothetical protein